MGLFALLLALCVAITGWLAFREGGTRGAVREAAVQQKRVDSLLKIRDSVARKATPALRRADSLRARVLVVHDTVHIADSTHLLVNEAPHGDTPARDTVIEVPVEVTRRITVDSQTIAAQRLALDALVSEIRVDSTVIGAQALAITNLKDALRAKGGPSWKVGVAGTVAVALIAKLVFFK